MADEESEDRQRDADVHADDQFSVWRHGDRRCRRAQAERHRHRGGGRAAAGRRHLQDPAVPADHPEAGRVGGAEAAAEAGEAGRGGPQQPRPRCRGQEQQGETVQVHELTGGSHGVPQDQHQQASPWTRGGGSLGAAAGGWEGAALGAAADPAVLHLQHCSAPPAADQAAAASRAGDTQHHRQEPLQTLQVTNATCHVSRGVTVANYS